MIEINGEVDAWITCYSDLKLSDLANPPKGFVNDLGYSDHDMSDQGWLKIGRAQITIAIDDQHQLVHAAIDSLRNAQKRVRAEAETRANAIEGQIQKLLAISYEG